MEYYSIENNNQEYHRVDFETKERMNTRVCDHKFLPVEKEALEELGNSQERVSQLDKEQYSFKNEPNILPYPRYIYPHNYGNHNKYPSNKITLQLRSGAVYNTVRENCLKPYKQFFQNAGKPSE